MICPAIPPSPQHDSRMLDRIVRIIKFRACHGHLILLTDHQHLFHPLRREDLHVVVQKEEIFSRGLFRRKIIDGGIIKFFFPHKHPGSGISFRDLLVICERIFLLAVVLHHKDFVVIPCGSFCQRGKTQFQIPDMILIGG